MFSAARGAKAQHLKQFYADKNDHFEVVKIADIAKDQFPEALIGVDAVIHTAAPLDATDAEATLNVRS
jgi:nucleoside-diphosphate-sugar epimerase